MKLLRDGNARTLRPTAAVLGLLALALMLPLTFAGTALAAQATVPLGAAGSFGALSATAMTNAGLDTVVNGDVGSSTSIDVGVTHPGFAGYVPPSLQLTNAQASLLIAYGNAEAQTPTGNITGANLAGQTLMPGVYNSTGSILISGPTALTLDGNGNADSVFIFQAASAGDLTVDPTSQVRYVNGAQPCNVFWKVQSAFLKNTGFTFVGTILALTQITLTDGITVEGRLLARNADVTFIHDIVNTPSTCVSQTSVNAGAAAEQAQSERIAAEQLAYQQAAETARLAEVARATEAAKVAAATAAESARVTAANVAAAKATAAKARAAKVKAVKAAKVRAAKVKAAKVKATKVKAAKVKAATAKKRAANSTHVGQARPARRHAGFTG